MVAVGVPSFDVVADQPAEHVAAAGGRVGPAGVVLQDFAFEGSVERFRHRIVLGRRLRSIPLLVSEPFE